MAKPLLDRANQAKVISGSGAPGSSNKGNIYYRTDTGAIYVRPTVAGSWTAISGTGGSSATTWSGTTTDANQTEIFVGGTPSERQAVAQNETIGFDLKCVARCDADNDSSYWSITGCIHRQTGNVALVGSVSVTQLNNTAGAATWDVTAEADTSNQALVIKVTGAASKTIQWVVSN